MPKRSRMNRNQAERWLCRISEKEKKFRLMVTGFPFGRMNTLWRFVSQNNPLAKDSLSPSPEEERDGEAPVQSPSPCFMDVKFPGGYTITMVFSQPQTVVLCVGCSTVLGQPTGGKERLLERSSFRRKQH
ncbi:small ribosomal subunit protein eS27-like [Lepus europaeus]|uniref:small ribosomal subunit protein eS27-like n=1 Tax=Lepus europaeus TaxID=9983 RepID=UPI002B48475B|nr:small ribosomal subunit protein eS27-like [Lepus europaeus]